MSSRSRSWCFTVNNYNDEELNILHKEKYKKQIAYAVIGEEIGENNTPHLQGYVRFKNQKIFDQLKKIYPRAHIELAKGSDNDNFNYCTKDNKYTEIGEKNTQGKRTDIDLIRQMVKEHKPMNEIAFAATSYQSLKHAETLMKYQDKPPSVKRNILWYYGEPGSGKTRLAIEQAGEDYYITMNNLKWWDGYTGQKYIIVDDFRKDFCTFHELLRILDRYPYRVNTKGSSMWLQPTTTHIIITSAYHPQVVYETREDIKQLLRRIDTIREFKI